MLVQYRFSGLAACSLQQQLQRETRQSVVDRKLIANVQFTPLVCSGVHFCTQAFLLAVLYCSRV
jgi:hypothetical protein